MKRLSVTTCNADAEVRRRMQRLGSFIFLCSLWMSTALAQDEPPPHFDDPIQSVVVAVLPFETDENRADVGVMVSDIIASRLDAGGIVQTVERQDLDRVLQEQGLALAEIVSNSRLPGLGHLLGADLLITGRLRTVDDKQYVTCKAISVRSGQVKGFFKVMPDHTELNGLLDALCDQLSDNLPGWTEALVDSGTNKQSYEPNLASILEGRQLPSIAVLIVESDSSVTPATQKVDPAAETAFKERLVNAGIYPIELTTEAKIAVTALLSERSDRNLGDDPTTDIHHNTEGDSSKGALGIAGLADLLDGIQYVVVGEAFSSEGEVLHGLRIAAVRAEARIVELSSGNNLAAGAVSASAPDLTYERASKTALEKAGLRLADKLLPGFFNQLPEDETDG